MRTALVSAGGPGPEEYREWLARGFTLVHAREWLTDGLELEEAECWRARGIGTASAALPLRVRGSRRRAIGRTLDVGGGAGAETLAPLDRARRADRDPPAPPEPRRVAVLG